MANVCRAQRRRAPLTLLGDWPENLHPASAGTQPSVEDLDRADVLSHAVAALPPGQRHAAPGDDPANHIAFAAGPGAWTQYEVTAQIPADASLIRFGVFLNGRGQIELRNPQLEPR